AKEMDETLAEFFRRTILKIPMPEMMTVLKTWNFLSENQLQTVNFRQRKESIVQDLVLLCESTLVLDTDADGDTQFHRHQKIWDVFQMSKGPGDDIDLFDMEQFKSSFKKILQRALKNVRTEFI
ncbi:CENPN, partial [Cervus elaphus hippelaphus]